jgi:ABC-type Co2+ transport system permease subunit
MIDRVRLIMIGFGLLAILGALTARGLLFGEGGLQTALGLTVLVTGVLGVLNTIFFVRLKAQIDKMAGSSSVKNEQE